MRYVILLSLISLFICSCSQDDSPFPTDTTAGLIDATGHGYSGGVPGRIVSLSPAITENLKLLGLAGPSGSEPSGCGLRTCKLVGRTDYCKTSKEIPSMGNILSPSIERIVSLKPDAALATKEGNQPATVGRLRELGINVFVFGESNSWREVKDNFILLGKLAGVPEQADNIINDLEQKLPTAKQITNRVRIFVQINTAPLMTAGPDTFINDIISYAGGENIGAKATAKWPAFSMEEVIRSNPDIIIVSEMGEMTNAAKDIWQKFPDIKAVRDNRIYVMESDLLCQPTPINFVRAVSQITEWIPK